MQSKSRSHTFLQSILLVIVIILCITIPTQQYWDTDYADGFTIEIFDVFEDDVEPLSYQSNDFYIYDYLYLEFLPQEDKIIFDYYMDSPIKSVDSTAYYLNISTISFTYADNIISFTPFALSNTSSQIELTQEKFRGILLGEINDIPTTIDYRINFHFTYNLISYNSSQTVTTIVQDMERSHYVRYHKNINTTLIQIFNITALTIVGFAILLRKEIYFTNFFSLPVPPTTYLANNAFRFLIVLFAIENFVHYSTISILGHTLLNISLIFGDIPAILSQFDNNKSIYSNFDNREQILQDFSEIHISWPLIFIIATFVLAFTTIDFLINLQFYLLLGIGMIYAGFMTSVYGKQNIVKIDNYLGN